LTNDSPYWSEFLLDVTLSTLVARAVALLLGFSVHEAAHAWVAFRLGDDTAKQQGRLTLNPLAHLDPLGAIMALVAMIGWAKPVPVSPWRLRYGPRVGFALVAAAGPLSNLAMAMLAAIPWRMGLLAGAPQFVLTLVWTFIALNIALFLFNLIPLAPLDGISVLSGIVGQEAATKLAPLYRFGPQILLGLILLGYVVPGFDILGLTLFPAMRGLMNLLLG
jgi:Zn-dependent protease